MTWEPSEKELNSPLQHTHTAHTAHTRAHTTEDRIAGYTDEHKLQRELGPIIVTMTTGDVKKEATQHFEAIETAKGNDWRF